MNSRISPQILSEDQLAIVDGYKQLADQHGCMTLVDEADTVVRWANLARIGWHLEQPLTPEDIDLILRGIRGEVTHWRHRRTLRRLSVFAAAYINNLLPLGYWCIQHNETFIITKVAFLPLS